MYWVTFIIVCLKSASISISPLPPSSGADTGAASIHSSDSLFWFPVSCIMEVMASSEGLMAHERLSDLFLSLLRVYF